MPAADPARQPQGVRIGGQYAPTGHDEADVSLDGSERGATDGADVQPNMTTWKRSARPLENIGLHSSGSSVREFMFAMRDEFDVTAEYQRESVWSEEKRRNLIRSLLLGIPVGTITVALRHWGTLDKGYRVVDGKQRIEALWAFADGEFGVPADWFDDECIDPELVDEEGLVRWNHGINRQGQRRFGHCTMTKSEFTSHKGSVRVEPGTGTGGENQDWGWVERTEAETIAFEAEVYRLINTGGVEHTAEQLARAAAVETGGR